MSLKYLQDRGDSGSEIVTACGRRDALVVVQLVKKGGDSTISCGGEPDVEDRGHFFLLFPHRLSRFEFCAGKGGEWEELESGESMSGVSERCFELDELVEVGCTAGVEGGRRRFDFQVAARRPGLSVEVSE